MFLNKKKLNKTKLTTVRNKIIYFQKIILHGKKKIVVILLIIIIKIK